MTKINITRFTDKTMQRYYLVFLTILALVPLAILLDEHPTDAQSMVTRTYDSLEEKTDMIKSFESQGYTKLHDDYVLDGKATDGTSGTLTFWVDTRISEPPPPTFEEEIANLKNRIAQLESDVTAIKLAN